MFATVIALAAAATPAPVSAPVNAAPAGTPAAAPTAAFPAPDELSAWVARVDRQLAVHLEQPITEEGGMATVSFRRGADGRPVEIAARSGSPFVSLAAIRTLRHAGVLPPLPASMPGNQRVTFRFLVGMPGHEDEYQAAHATMIAAARQANTALAAQIASRVRVAALPGSRVELAALTR